MKTDSLVHQICYFKQKNDPTAGDFYYYDDHFMIGCIQKAQVPPEGTEVKKMKAVNDLLGPYVKGLLHNKWNSTWVDMIIVVNKR